MNAKSYFGSCVPYILLFTGSCGSCLRKTGQFILGFSGAKAQVSSSVSPSEQLQACGNDTQPSQTGPLWGRVPESKEQSLHLGGDRPQLERARLPRTSPSKGSTKVILSIACSWLHQNLKSLDIFLRLLPWSSAPANLVS